MVVIETCPPTTDLNALETLERHWIETLKSSLNKKIPTRT